MKFFVKIVIKIGKYAVKSEKVINFASASVPAHPLMPSSGQPESRAGSAHSSMDRIMDSGSIDWGSTPHGRTQRRRQRAACVSVLI